MFLQVYVNSLQYCTFKHRIPLEKVSTLGIRGDITINYFGFIEVSKRIFFDRWVLCELTKEKCNNSASLV